jgi:hypothetical protein
VILRGISLHEGTDTSTANGRLVFQIFGAIAEFERELIRDRVRSGLAHAKAKGQKLGRPRTGVSVEQLKAAFGCWCDDVGSREGAWGERGNAVSLAKGLRSNNNSNVLRCDRMGKFLVSIFLISTALAAVGSNLGTLKGHVKDPSGAALAHAIVRLACWTVPAGTKALVAQTEKITYTDTNGNFAMQVTAGVCDVIVSGPAYSPVAKKVKIEAGKDVTFNPNLHFDRLTQFTD